MDRERYEVSEETAEAIHRTKQSGGRVVAVGTTVVRTLESAALAGGGEARPGAGSTELFITPGFGFQVVDVLLTNFHLPRSTLLMLVSAFAGRERVLAAYEEAVRAGYRFYSYGDAMLVERGQRHKGLQGLPGQKTLVPEVLAVLQVPFFTSRTDIPMPSGSLPAVSEPTFFHSPRSTMEIWSALAWAT